MSKETFTWTNALLVEWGEFYINHKGRLANLMESPLEAFIQSKMPKKDKDYEVTEIINKHGGKITKTLDHVSWENYCVESFDGFKINAVKRLSDGEVFTVGEMVGNKHESKSEIRNFQIVNSEQMMVHFIETPFVCDICWLSKLPPQSKPEQPKKERIEVIKMTSYNPLSHCIGIVTGEPISEKKFPTIKASIERVLNDDEDADIKFAESKGWTCVKTHEYQLKLREAEEKAFNAARKMVHSGSYVEDQLEKVLKSSLESMAAYKDASDYLNHKSKQP